MARDKRADRLTTLAGAILAVGFLAVILGPALLGRGVLLDVGLLTRYLPFGAGGVHTGAIWCRSDTIDGVLPALAQIRAGVHSGDLPTWAPWETGGAPLASQPQNNFLNPTIWPYLLLPIWLAPAFSTLLQMVAGIVGMVAFLGRWGVSRGAALVAGVAFVASGFMIMWHGWPHVAVACFIPALFWAVERSVAQPSPRSIAWLGLVIACMLLGGFPSVTLYALTGAAVYALARLVAEGRRRGVRHAVLGALTSGAGVVLGALLSAVQMLPFVRELGTVGLDTRDFSNSHLPASSLLTTLAPGAFGTCTDGHMFGERNAVEMIAFAGAAVLVLAVFALVARPRTDTPSRPRWILAAILVVAGAAIWTGGIAFDVLKHLPYFKSNMIGRATSLTGFLLAALAGFGLDRLLHPSTPPDEERTAEDAVADGRRRHLRVVGAVVGAVVVVAAGLVAWWAWAEARTAAREAHSLGALMQAVHLPLVALALAIVGVVAAALLRGRLRLLVTACVAVLLVAQSTAFAHRELPLSSRDDFYPITDTHRFLQDNLDGYRYAAQGREMYVATSDYYRLRTPVGHQFTQPGWADLIKTVDPDAMPTPTFSMFNRLPDAGGNPILDQLSVRYWVTDPSYVPGRSVASDGADATGPEVTLDAGAVAHCTVPGGAIAGVQVELTADHPVNTYRAARLHVRVSDAEGTTKGARAIATRLRSGPQRVALESSPPETDSPRRVDVWFTGLRTPVSLAGTAAGGISCEAVRPSQHMTLVQATPGANVYERPNALPRIRWASRSEIVTDRLERLKRMAAGLPRDTVLLEQEDAQAATGAPADVHVVADDPERISADVKASGLGYLVVGDAIVRAGWTAYVDGRATPILQANHAFGAVAVPAGEHRVELRYTAPGLRTGMIISIIALLLTLALLLVPALVSTRSRARAAARRREQ
ncbi:YfhO family protein [Nocardioides sp. CER19]|uniref:YfhO family protein n=1 Tax=Nocardioides sp. CER19 TaxID=3038538 RepID=UPI00244A4CCB|nr:YfhO family protein [Nocardioides sp. CER19]MDH2416938.1 YfhO family protein [Nocardioides sp. CER19]